MANIVDYSQLSMLEVAKEIVKNSEGPVAVSEIIKKVLELKNVDDNGDKATQLYVDITTSADFVYMGDNTWDLKDRQSLEEWDKDASVFNKAEVEDDDDEIKSEDFNMDDEDIAEAEDEEEEDSTEYDENDMKNPYADDDDMEAEDTDESEFDTIRDNPDDDEEFDEDKYGDIMDSYEDLYDK